MKPDEEEARREVDTLARKVKMKNALVHPNILLIFIYGLGLHLLAATLL